MNIIQQINYTQHRYNNYDHEAKVIASIIRNSFYKNWEEKEQ